MSDSKKLLGLSFECLSHFTYGVKLTTPAVYELTLESDPSRLRQIIANSELQAIKTARNTSCSWDWKVEFSYPLSLYG